MKLVLNRYHSDTAATDGHIFVDGHRICATLEATPHLLPAGKYDIAPMKCKLKNQKILLLLPHAHLFKGKPSPSMCQQCCDLHQQIETLREKELLMLQKAIDEGADRDTLLRLEASLDNLKNAQIGALERKLAMHCPCSQMGHGNGVCHHTNGSILVGEYQLPGSLLHSKQCCKLLDGRIRKSLGRGRKSTLRIL